MWTRTQRTEKGCPEKDRLLKVKVSRSEHSVISTIQAESLTKPKCPNSVWQPVHTSLLWAVYSAPRSPVSSLEKLVQKSQVLIILHHSCKPCNTKHILHSTTMTDLREPVKYEFVHVYEEIKIRVDKHSTEETRWAGQCGKQIQWTKIENLLRHLLQNIMEYI